MKGIVSHYLKSLSSLSSLKKGMYLSSALLATTMSANAMLPTPEPEMSNPSNQTNARILAQAQSPQSQASALATKTVAAIVSVDSSGNAVLKPVTSDTRIQRGTVIEYHTYVTNNSNDLMRKMDITMSIPSQLKLVGKVSPESAQASVDGTNFSYMPIRGRINGQITEVPLEYYKHLRWTVEGLDKNETAVVKYRATVR